MSSRMAAAFSKSRFFGGLAHLLLALHDVRVELGLRLEVLDAVADERRRAVIAFVHARHDVVDLLHDRLRRDAVFLVVRLLQRPAAARFRRSPLPSSA